MTALVMHTRTLHLNNDYDNLVISSTVILNNNKKIILHLHLLTDFYIMYCN